LHLPLTSAHRDDARAAALQGAGQLTIPGSRFATPRTTAQTNSDRSAGQLIDRLGNFTSAQMGKVHSALTSRRANLGNEVLPCRRPPRSDEGGSSSDRMAPWPTAAAPPHARPCRRQPPPAP